jgi:hypothetical protein
MAIERLDKVNVCEASIRGKSFATDILRCEALRMSFSLTWNCCNVRDKGCVNIKRIIVRIADVVIE